MLIVTNEQFVRRRARIGKYATLLGFAGLAGGFVISLFMSGSQSQDYLLVLVAYASLIVGLIGINVGRYHNARWGRRPREEEILGNAMKGLDYKYQLYNYQDYLPVDHLLLSPFGLFVLEARYQYGQITNRGDRWQRRGGVWAFVQMFAEGGLGNPTKDALRATEAVRKTLHNVLTSEEADQVAVEPAIVFTSPMAKVTAENPVVPVLVPKDLRTFVRAPANRTKLSNEMFRKLARILAPQERK